MRPFTILVLAGALALAAPAYSADTQTPAGKAPAKKAAASTTSSQRKPATLVARGTIASFDRTSHMLTIKTAKGQEQFPVADSVRIQEASKRLTAADLESLNGRAVSIRYTESGGQRTVQSVQVSRGGKKVAKT